MATEISEQDALLLFAKLQLPEQKLKETAHAKKVRASLAAVLSEAQIDDSCTKSQGTFLLAAANKYPVEALPHRQRFLQEYIVNEKLATTKQLDAAFAYLKSSGDEPYDAAKLDAACGVGVTVTAEEIQAAVKATLEEQSSLLKANGHRTNRNMLLAKVMAKQPWADGPSVKSELDRQVDAVLGPKTEADERPLPKAKPAKKEKPAAEAKAKAAPANGHEAEEWRTADPYAMFPKPGDNRAVHTSIPFSDAPTMHVANTAEQLNAHLKTWKDTSTLPFASLPAEADAAQATDGRFMTRFPPEPNGYLHIGHAKAMFVDFGLAKQYGGSCYLRFDDTNPEAEKQEFIDHIQDIVAWLGWAPWKITYSSDYFQALYDLAVELIRRGHAYVDHQTAEEVSQYRERREGSPWRDRPQAESLKLFEDMRRGLVAEGKATLRMRMDPKNENFNMFDLIAYRVKFVAHPRAGTQWCIYPSYDYTHCLVDSLEQISHSLCTLEFETRRASYYWLLEVLGLYKPLVWEFARLNVTHNVMSKRKLLKLVNEGLLRGWDDPRALTLAGMRRRGVTPQALNNFCREGGITRNAATAHLHKLDHHVRLDLDASSPRCLAVLEPLRLVLDNLPADYHTAVQGRVFPGRTEETYDMPLTRVVYIETSDFQEAKTPGYYGFCPQQPVLLKYSGMIVTFKSLERDASGTIRELHAECHPQPEGQKLPKGVLSWVGQPRPGQEPPCFEARLYDVLFRSQEPADLGDAWLQDLNPDSEVVLRGAFASPPLAAAKPGDRFQLERLGYFCVDQDSSAVRMIVNRTCTLRETFPKG